MSQKLKRNSEGFPYLTKITKKKNGRLSQLLFSWEHLDVRNERHVILFSDSLFNLFLLLSTKKLQNSRRKKNHYSRCEAKEKNFNFFAKRNKKKEKKILLLFQCRQKVNMASSLYKNKAKFLL